MSGTGLFKEAKELHRQAISISQFIDRHAPIYHNLESMDLELYARFKRGLSKTTPIVILRQDQFREAPDIMSDDDKHVMNGGRARMSLSPARETARQQGLDEIPSAFQGRISRAKGPWMVDQRDIQRVDSKDCWIEVTPSQLKIKPHPVYRLAYDEYRQFEVTDQSQPPHTPALSTQFLAVLEDRGVPSRVIEDYL